MSARDFKSRNYSQGHIQQRESPVSLPDSKLSLLLEE